MAKVEPRALIVSANFYPEISAHLEQDAQATLEAHGVSNVTLKNFPGVFELPTAVAMQQARFDLVVALGVVIRGETSHYELICHSVTQALQTLAWQHSIALGFGVITAENKTQAEVRADPQGDASRRQAGC